MDMEQLYSYVPRELVTFVLVTLFSFINRTFATSNQSEA